MAGLLVSVTPPASAAAFADVPTSHWAYSAVQYVTSKGWVNPYSNGFRPEQMATRLELARAFVLAFAPSETPDPSIVFSDLSPTNYGYSYKIANIAVKKGWLSPTVSRAFLSYALWQAKTLSQWELNSLQAYATITLPQMNAIEKQVVGFAFRYAGYPYVYAGEWYKPTGSGYCCGTQLQGGFDCSGFAWWVLKASSGTWNNVSIRGYTGWSLPQRGAAAMTEYAPVRYYYAQLQPGDLLGFNTDDQGTGWSGVDHAGIYLGNGWMVHSSGSRGGVSIDYIGSGSWWYSRLVWGRRLLPTYTPPPPPPPPPPPSPSPSPTPSSTP